MTRVSETCRNNMSLLDFILFQNINFSPKIGINEVTSCVKLGAKYWRRDNCLDSLKS